MLRVATETSLPWIKSRLSLVLSCFLRGNSDRLRFAGLALPLLTVTPRFFPTARHILQLFPTDLPQWSKPPLLKKEKMAESYSSSDTLKESDMRCEQCGFWKKDIVSCHCLCNIIFSKKKKKKWDKISRVIQTSQENLPLPALKKALWDVQDERLHCL